MEKQPSLLQHKSQFKEKKIGGIKFDDLLKLVILE